LERVGPRDPSGQALPVEDVDVEVDEDDRCDGEEVGDGRLAGGAGRGGRGRPRKVRRASRVSPSSSAGPSRKSAGAASAQSGWVKERKRSRFVGANGRS